MDTQAGRVVVGYDGSPHAGAALDWAAAYARRRHLPLTVLNVVDYLGQLPATLPTVPMPRRVEEVAGQAAQQVTTEGVHRAHRQAGSIDITAVTHVSRVAYSLIEHSREATLLVVGTRGHGELSGALLGSVAFAVSGHAHCPVLVVRGDTALPPGPDRPVVVGVDASPGSDAAVCFAADQADADAADLIVVTAYQSLSAQISPEGRSFDEAVRQAAELAVTAATDVAERRCPGLSVVPRVTAGSVAEVLTGTADGAGLVVVGARGHGGFAGLRLGSVSHHLIHSSPCPVAVISDAEADRSEADPGPSQLEQCDPSRSGPSSLPPTPTSDED